MPEGPQRPPSNWDVGSIIKDVGFPALVALILLYQIPPFAGAIEKLSATLSSMDNTLREQLRELRNHRARTERGMMSREEDE